MKLIICAILALTLAHSGYGQHCDMSNVVPMRCENGDSELCYEDEECFTGAWAKYDTIITAVVAAANIPANFIMLVHVTGKKKFYAGRERRTNPPRPLICYNPKYIDDMYTECGANDGMLKTLAAHEIGHILQYHIMLRDGRLTKEELREKKHAHELQADYFAGRMAAKMGVHVCDALRWLYIMCDTAASNTHPNRQTRVDMLLAGYKLGSLQMNDTAYKLWPEFTDRPAEMITMFNDTVVNIYDLGGGGIVTTKNGVPDKRYENEYISIEESTDKNYKLIIVVEQPNLPRNQQRQRYFIDNNGDIWNSKDKDLLPIVGRQIK